MNKSYSILLLAQEREIAKLTLNGLVLDVGGDKCSGYQSLLKGNHQLHSINIDEKAAFNFLTERLQ